MSLNLINHVLSVNKLLKMSYEFGENISMLGNLGIMKYDLRSPKSIGPNQLESKSDCGQAVSFFFFLFWGDALSKILHIHLRLSSLKVNVGKYFG